MHNPPLLTAAVAGIHHLAVPLRELAFRVSHLRHFPSFAAAHPLFCAPAGPEGSRFIAPNGPAALYLALKAETAYEEFNADFFRVAHTPAGRALTRSGGNRPDPAVTLGVHLQPSRVLNLAFPRRHWHATRTALGINTLSDAEITQPWAGIPHAPTQVLGTEIYNDSFFEGILYPSARKARENCLVVFRARLLPGSRVQFADAATGIAEQLP